MDVRPIQDFFKEEGVFHHGCCLELTENGDNERRIDSLSVLLLFFNLP